MKVVVSLGENPKKIIVFVIDEYGRTLTKKSLHKLISELFDKALNEQNADAVVFSGPSIDICANLADQIIGKDISEWEIIYLHGSKYPPVLLTRENKEKLLALLPEFKGTSAEAIYKVLIDSGVFGKFQ
jgi:hypothetical protein